MTAPTASSSTEEVLSPVAVEQQAEDAGKKEEVVPALSIELELPDLLSPRTLDGGSNNTTTTSLPSASAISLQALPQTTIQEICQFIFNHPSAQFITCFYLSHQGRKLSNTESLEDIFPEPNPDDRHLLQIVIDNYTDDDIRVHLEKFVEVLHHYDRPEGLSIDSAISYLTQVSESSCSPSACGEDITITNESDDYITPNMSALLKNSSDMPYICPSGYLPKSLHLPESCLSDLSLSSWNPPNRSRRMKGEFLYLTHTTLEGQSFDIVCCYLGFWAVEASSVATRFPTLAAETKVFATLPALLGHLCPTFSVQFEQLQSLVSSRHVFEHIATLTPSHPWIVADQAEQFQRPARAISTYMAALDPLSCNNSRDWNEELQQAREMPKITAQQRVARDNAIHRLYMDFVTSATELAVALVNRAPMPDSGSNRDEISDMFIHNNIFFTVGFEHQKDQFDAYGGEAAVHVAVSKDINALETICDLDIDNLFTLGTAIIDYKGVRIVAQTMVPGLLRKVSNPDAESSVCYGSIDYGKEIFHNEEFHQLFSKVAEPLRIAEHTVVDNSGKEHKLACSVEVKGVLGSDERKYILDLHRMHPVDIEFLEKKEGVEEDYPHRIALIRSEMIQLFYSSKMTEELKKRRKLSPEMNEYGQYLKSDAELLAGASFDHLRFNPDAFTEVKQASEGGEKYHIELVRELSKFIESHGIPQLFLSLLNFPANVPVDGEGLSKTLHRHGINMRYLGSICRLFEKLPDSPITYLHHLCLQEIAVRSAKHVLREKLKLVRSHEVSSLVAHFLNCFYAKTSSDVVAEKGVSAAISSITPHSLQSRIRKEALARFRYSLPGNFSTRRRLPSLRSLCKAIGIQIRDCPYNWSNATNGLIFSSDDILNIVPTVKYPQMKSYYVEQLREASQQYISKNDPVGVDLLVETLSFAEQVYGPVHSETGQLCSHLAVNLFQREDFVNAVAYQRKAVICSERTQGFDDPDTIQQLMNLAYFENANGNPEMALRCMQHITKMWSLITGEHTHPETSSCISHIASFLEKSGRIEESLKFYEKSLELNASLVGESHAMTTLIHEHLMKNYRQVGKLREAVASAKAIYKFYKANLGSEHDKVVESFKTLQTLTSECVAEAKKGKASGAH